MATVQTSRKKEERITAPRIADVYPFALYTPVLFSHIGRHAKAFADYIEDHKEGIIEFLLIYESFEVAEDEIVRTLDVLRSLSENESYFEMRVGDIAVFLPRNQPLYALTCFVLVPSYIASAVHFRVPHSMRHFMPQLLEILDIAKRYPNVRIAKLERLEFLRERSALKIDPGTRASLPVTDAVIFTGTPAHADQLRLVFDERTLFITNGAGHNPVVVAPDANLGRAVEAVLTLQLYNQGQDCAAPKSVLVHRAVYAEFLDRLKQGLREVKIGEYRDRSVRVGPISDPFDLVRIQEFLIRHRQWIDPSTPGIIHAHESIVEPTIIAKPLSEGGNYTELFAPIIIVQVYDDDSELASYFTNTHYAKNAMYVTVYGTSAYVLRMLGKKIDGVVLHGRSSYLHNKHLHERGMERGTKPYGGNGYGASNYTIRGKTVCKATLPPRDIYTEVARPLLRSKELAAFRKRLAAYTALEYRNVEKILRLGTQAKEEMPKEEPIEYVDMNALHTDTGKRFAIIDKEFTYQLLDRPNAECIARLTPTKASEIRALKTLLTRRNELTLHEFSTIMYSLPHKPDPLQPDKRTRQRKFFQTLYQLLFGKDNGPNLAQFLSDVDHAHVQSLLDV